LLGSIHLLGRNMYPLDARIERAFARSGVLVVETDVRDGAGEERKRRILEGAMYPEGDTIANHLSEKTVDLWRRRFPEMPLDAVGRLKPWALAMTVTVLEYRKLGLEYENGIDRYFLDKAADGKRIRELEPPDYVIGMLNGFSDEYQDLFLRYTLLDLEQVEEKAALILRAWTSGDAAAMEEILTESVREYPRLGPVFDALFYRRNGTMAAAIERYLREEGEFFVVVGAGHLVGEKGIVERLKKKGFSVEQQ
ncbi:MAG TPA: TraB/GumN family protein, partial [Candidatus Aquicultoraceae bacterium]|nr:TraB/GumN family protein [Candidatus Aquicultoraceae bacterium]